MSLPGPGNPLSIRQINAEFGLGYNLDAYRGKRYFYADGRTGLFPAGTISISDFYSTQSANPVIPSTVTFTRSGLFVVPSAYTTMIVTTRGGGGGAAGATGTNQCDNNIITYGSDGFQGGASSFNDYSAAAGGQGGTAVGIPGNNGGPHCDGIPAGGGGVGGGGSGGAGGYQTVTLISPQAGGGGPEFNSTVIVTVGLGGAGGQGGPNFQIWNGACTLINYAVTGQKGVDGSVFISWT